MALIQSAFIFFFLLFPLKGEKKKKKSIVILSIICAAADLSHNLSARIKHITAAIQAAAARRPAVTISTAETIKQQ